MQCFLFFIHNLCDSGRFWLGWLVLYFLFFIHNLCASVRFWFVQKSPRLLGEGQGEGLLSVIGASKDGTLPLINFVVIKFISFDLYFLSLFTCCANKKRKKVPKKEKNQAHD